MTKYNVSFGADEKTKHELTDILTGPSFKRLIDELQLQSSST